VLVVLPAYNEEVGLGQLIPAWQEVLTDQQLPHRFIIVDDGSSDGTAELLLRFAATCPLTVITHCPNQGLGATIRDGLNEAVRQAGDDDVIVTMDADNTHPPELFPFMLNKLMNENLDVVIASRYRSGSEVVGLALHRKLLSDGARWLFQIAFPIRGVRDYTCGYRAYRAGFLRHAMRVFGEQFCDQPGFACMVDILLKLARCDARCGEVGMVLRYDQKAGPSAMRISQTIGHTLRLLLHHRFAKRFPRP
jgi:dolichol-phosphate mannosyltransferase